MGLNVIGAKEDENTGLPCEHCHKAQKRINVEKVGDVFHVRVAVVIPTKKEMSGLLKLLKMFAGGLK